MQNEKGRNFFKDKPQSHPIKTKDLGTPRSGFGKKIKQELPFVSNGAPHPINSSVFKKRLKQDPNSSQQAAVQAQYNSNHKKKQQENPNGRLILKQMAPSLTSSNNTTSKNNAVTSVSKQTSRQKSNDSTYKFKIKNSNYLIDPSTKKITHQKSKKRLQSFFKKIQMVPLSTHEIEMRNQIEKRFKRSAMRNYEFVANYNVKVFSPRIHFEKKLQNQRKESQKTDLKSELEFLETKNLGQSTTTKEQEKLQVESAKSEDMEQYNYLKSIKIVDLTEFHKILATLKRQKSKPQKDFNQKYQHLRVKTELSDRQMRLNLSSTPNNRQIVKDTYSIDKLSHQSKQWRFVSLIANGANTSKSKNKKTLKINSHRTLQPADKSTNGDKEIKYGKINNSYQKFRQETNFSNRPTPKLKANTKTPKKEQYQWI